MLGSLLVFAAFVVGAGIVGYILSEYLPDLMHLKRIKASEEAVKQLINVEKPTWATSGKAHIDVSPSYDGVAGCTVSASFTGEGRYEHSKVSYHPRG